MAEIHDRNRIRKIIYEQEQLVFWFVVKTYRNLNNAEKLRELSNYQFDYQIFIK